MEVQKQKLDGSKVELKVEIEAEKVNDALEQAYRKVVKDVSLPGFRKGKVPRRVLEANYGKEVLHRDALDILISPAYMEAVDETGIEPINQPQINDFYIAEDEPAAFTAVVEVKPEVKLGQYTDLDIEKEEAEVTEEEITAELERMQEENSQLESTDREVVEEGDFVVIDFEGFIDDEPISGGSAEEFTLEIGSGSFVPGFEEKLIGEKTGTKTEIELTFPEEYQAEDLAGKEAVFKVDIKEIKEKNTPELNDDFAREVSDFDTLVELKEDIESNLSEQKENRVKNEYQDKLIEKILENVEVEIPDVLVDNELDMMFYNFSISLSNQGLAPDQYLEQMGMDKETWREQNRSEAEKRAKSNLVLEAIGEKEGIEVSDEEVDNRVEEMAEDSEKSAEEIKEFLKNNNQLDGLIHSMEINKVMDFLEENNKTE